MSAAILDKPAALGHDPFVDALLGLASACRILDDAEIRGQLSALVPADRPEMIEAILGALSLRKTIELVIAGICEEVPGASLQEPAGWERELLR
jgi:hypothetical protein